jgi:RNA recognition motif-containing protein
MAKRLFVGGLPYSITSTQLEEMFSKLGTVVSAIVITDRDTGQSKGFGFVEMEKDEEADKAIEKLNK